MGATVVSCRGEGAPSPGAGAWREGLQSWPWPRCHPARAGLPSSRPRTQFRTSRLAHLFLHLLFFQFTNWGKLRKWRRLPEQSQGTVLPASPPGLGCSAPEPPPEATAVPKGGRKKQM